MLSNDDSVITIDRSNVLSMNPNGCTYAGELKGKAVVVKQLSGVKKDDVRVAALLAPWMNVTHPHVIRLESVGSIDGDAALVMERSGSGSSAQLMSTAPFNDRVRWLRQTASALKHLHSNSLSVVHGDLKPSSLWIDSENNAKLSCIGLIRVRQLSRHYSTPDHSIARVAPESLADTDVASTPAQDVYAFGMVAYELLTLHRPFQGKHAAAIPFLVLNNKRPKRVEVVPDVLWTLIEKCWEQVPVLRPEFEEIEEVLEGWLDGRRTESAQRYPNLDRHRRPPAYEEISYGQFVG